MIDDSGFRSNVGIILANFQGKIFWGKRVNQHGWQFPQGGINENESIEDALFRELQEEIGLVADQVTIIGSTKKWLRYKLPGRLVRDQQPKCIGQKQKWFLLKLVGKDEDIDLQGSGHPEFDDWKWVNYWFPLREVVSFKREVYRKALKELSVNVFGVHYKGGKHKGLNHLLEEC